MEVPKQEGGGVCDGLGERDGPSGRAECSRRNSEWRQWRGLQQQVKVKREKQRFRSMALSQVVELEARRLLLASRKPGGRRGRQAEGDEEKGKTPQAGSGAWGDRTCSARIPCSL